MNVETVAALLRQVAIFYKEDVINSDQRAYLKDLLLSSDPEAVGEAQAQIEEVLAGEQAADDEEYYQQQAADAYDDYETGLYADDEGAYYNDDPNAVYFQDEEGNFYQQPEYAEPEYYQDEDGNVFTYADGDDDGYYYDGYDGGDYADYGNYYEGGEEEYYDDGEEEYYDDEQLYEDEYGNLYDAAGNLLEYAEEPELYEDEYGNVVDQYGNYYDDEVEYAEEEEAEEEEPYYPPGWYRAPDGANVYVDSEYNVWDEDELERSYDEDYTEDYPQYYENPNDYEGYYEEYEPQYEYFDEEPYEGYEAFMGEQPTRKSFLKRKRSVGRGQRRMSQVGRPVKNFTNWRKQSRDLRTQIKQAKKFSPRKKTGGTAFPTQVPVLVSKKGKPRKKSSHTPIKKRFMKPVQAKPNLPWRKASRHLRVQVKQAKKLSPRPDPSKENPTFPEVEVIAPKKPAPSKKPIPSKARPAGGEKAPNSDKKPKIVRKRKNKPKAKKISLTKVPYKQKSPEKK